MLEFHKHIILNLLPKQNPTELPEVDQEDDLVILGKGLGISEVIQSLILLYSHSKNLVLLLNTPKPEFELLHSNMLDHALNQSPELNDNQKIYPQYFKFIDSMTSPAERYIA